MLVGKCTPTAPKSGKPNCFLTRVTAILSDIFYTISRSHRLSPHRTTAPPKNESITLIDTRNYRALKKQALTEEQAGEVALLMGVYCRSLLITRLLCCVFI